MVQINEEIPDFEIDAYHEDSIKRIKLSDYRGKWLVLLFYPEDFTFICPTELEEAADLYESFKAEGTEIISISTDSAWVHKAWHDSSKAVGKVKYPMAADPSGKVCKAFGTYIEDKGIAHRASLIIDPEGVLKAMDIHDDSIGRSSREILRKLQASKFVRENEGHVCPASWKPGNKTLKKVIDLVGKI